MATAIILLALIFVTGLCIGSFLNVVILRSLSNESIVFPASKCPKCQHKLYWWHNIPLLSYILLKGKCGFCKEKISIQYPIIEFLTSIIFVMSFLRFGISLDTLFAWIISSLFIVLAVTDIKEKIVFDAHTYSLIGVGLFYGILITAVDMYNYYSLMGQFQFTTEWLVGNHITISLLGIILGFVLMEAVSRTGYLIAGTRAFGEGDSYIAAGLGAIFGWKILLLVLVLSIVIQILLTIPLFIKKELDKKNWISLTALTLFIILAIGFFTIQQYGLMDNLVKYIIGLVILIGAGIWACIEILKGIKSEENRTYLPFGPALVSAGLIVLLF